MCVLEIILAQLEDLDPIKVRRVRIEFSINKSVELTMMFSHPKS